MDTSRRSITRGKNFRIGGLNPARAHCIRTPHSNPKIFRSDGVHGLTNPLFAIAGQKGMAHKWIPSGYTRETTRPTTHLFRFGPLNRPASYMLANRANGPRRSVNDWIKIKKREKKIKEAPNTSKQPEGQDRES